ncbi:hypothetical protein F5878DRAFT_588901 [Lentinula raphanica]|uniref:GCM domain-containing protein n=1 Tax=Lentinula raphanica TaxID=153919 RepID=A0AA38U9S7_9AGAR|nr:hypothetical protein F5878DRAFT_588901 [Lentinula raphanica]
MTSSVPHSNYTFEPSATPFPHYPPQFPYLSTVPAFSSPLSVPIFGQALVPISTGGLYPYYNSPLQIPYNPGTVRQYEPFQPSGNVHPSNIPAPPLSTVPSTTVSPNDRLSSTTVLPGGELRAQSSMGASFAAAPLVWPSTTSSREGDQSVRLFSAVPQNHSAPNLGTEPSVAGTSFPGITYQSTSTVRPELHAPASKTPFPSPSVSPTITIIPPSPKTAEKKSTDTPVPLPPPNTTAETWDGWINGNVIADFSWDDIEKTHDLMVHWARKDRGTRGTSGNEYAEEWSLGKKNTRCCLGVIVCENDECNTIIRPQTIPGGVQRQLLKRCRCNAKLRRVTCGVQMVIWTWKDGKHIENSGFHTHPRVTHLLHPLPNERVRFEELVDNNPSATPAQLLVGQRTLSGVRKSAANISPIYTNRDRIAKDRQRIINSAKYSGGDRFISGFHEFHQEHPHFIVHSIFGEINMICMQSDFMRARLLNGISQRHDEPVNGIVSDAAHGFWREQNSLLITSSVYDSELRCWMPVLFSYSDGASTEHYTRHFLVLMLSIGQSCTENKIPVKDEYFAGIMDFSQAEKG